MEQFTRKHQDTLNQYLSGEIGERALISLWAAAWPNYESDYRALVEFAKRMTYASQRMHQSPLFSVLAARLPYLEQLSSEQRLKNYTLAIALTKRQVHGIDAPRYASGTNWKAVCRSSDLGWNHYGIDCRLPSNDSGQTSDPCQQI